jgi:hypothetical protein
VKTHLLRRESITPIARYLARRGELPDSAARQLEFAAVLLYREREYRSMHMASWWSGARPAPSPDSPFAPYDITAEAAGYLTALLDDARLIEAPSSPDDLFGLKASAIDGLRRTLRLRKADAFGWVVLARLHRDLREYADADAASEHAADLGETDTELDERVRKLAWRRRSEVEAGAFTRFLTTDRAYCESEREAAMAGFDEAKVPEPLRELIPLARQIGVGDDTCRGLFVRKMPARERRAAAQLIARHGAGIDAWLETRDTPHTGEAAAFFWLRAAGEELG